MSNQIEEVLQNVSLRVLSDWAMTMADPASQEQAEFKPEMPIYKASVLIAGHFKAELMILSQQDFMQDIAANLTGDDADQVDLEEQKDALREMGNVLAGNFLSEAFGVQHVFDLACSDVVEIDQPEFNQVTQSPLKFYFIADDAPTIVIFNQVK